jgi:hypothetical protein
MTNTSNSYEFVNEEQIIDFITDAFEKCGAVNQTLSQYQLKSAHKSLNYIFSHWSNYGVQLWATDQQMIDLIPGQATYETPPGTIDVISDNELVLLQTTRSTTTTGVAASSSGVPANAFDENLATFCTQNAPNGWISYNMGADNQLSIPYIGVVSATTQIYKLAVQGSNDGTNWTTYNIPETLTYPALKTTWIVPVLSPVYQYFRIIETNGATLNIAELYFNYFNSSRVIQKISRQQYVASPNISQQTMPTAYLVNRQIKPVITLYPTPSTDTTFGQALYYRKRAIQDVGTFINNPDTPQRFFMALSDALAAEMALRYFPEKYPLLKDRADKSYSLAFTNDIEEVSINFSIAPQYGGYR